MPLVQFRLWTSSSCMLNRPISLPPHPLGKQEQNANVARNPSVSGTQRISDRSQGQEPSLWLLSRRGPDGLGSCRVAIASPHRCKDPTIVVVCSVSAAPGDGGDSEEVESTASSRSQAQNGLPCAEELSATGTQTLSSAERSANDKNREGGQACTRGATSSAHGFDKGTDQAELQDIRGKEEPSLSGKNSWSAWCSERATDEVEEDGDGELLSAQLAEANLLEACDKNAGCRGVEAKQHTTAICAAKEEHPPPPICQSDLASILIAGSSLQLRGRRKISQPLIDSAGNVLAFNGEIFGGLKMESSGNDAEALLDALGQCCSSCNRHSCTSRGTVGNVDYDSAGSCVDAAKGCLTVPKVMSRLRGPWAFVYWQNSASTLWYGRDAVGRRSLVAHFPDRFDARLMVASVILESTPSSGAAGNNSVEQQHHQADSQKTQAQGRAEGKALNHEGCGCGPCGGTNLNYESSSCCSDPSIGALGADGRPAERQVVDDVGSCSLERQRREIGSNKGLESDKNRLRDTPGRPFGCRLANGEDEASGQEGESRSAQSKCCGLHFSGSSARSVGDRGDTNVCLSSFVMGNSKGAELAGVGCRMCSEHRQCLCGQQAKALVSSRDHSRGDVLAGAKAGVAAVHQSAFEMPAQSDSVSHRRSATAVTAADGAEKDKDGKVARTANSACGPEALVASSQVDVGLVAGRAEKKGSSRRMKGRKKQQERRESMEGSRIGKACVNDCANDDDLQIYHHQAAQLWGPLHTWVDVPCGIFSVVLPPQELPAHSSRPSDNYDMENTGRGRQRSPSDDSNAGAGMVGLWRKHKWEDDCLRAISEWNRGAAAAVVQGTAGTSSESVLTSIGFCKHCLVHPAPSNSVEAAMSRTTEFCRQAAAGPSCASPNQDRHHCCVATRMVPSPDYFDAAVQRVMVSLEESIRRRVLDIRECRQPGGYLLGLTTPREREDGHGSVDLVTASPVAILFSGGVDSMIIAGLAGKHVPHDRPIDLINVCFDGGCSPDRQTAIAGLAELRRILPSRHWRLIKVDSTLDEVDRKREHILSLLHPSNTYMDLNIGAVLWLAAKGEGWVHFDDDNNQATAEVGGRAGDSSKAAPVHGRTTSRDQVDAVDEAVPTVQTGSFTGFMGEKGTNQELAVRQRPNNGEGDVRQNTGDGVAAEKKSVCIPFGQSGREASSKAPHEERRGAAVRNAANGRPWYRSQARVLLIGSGADEQCAGYGRHRTKFREGGWEALEAEMRLDVHRLWQRNLGRDDRCTADHGREARFPFLDEDVMLTLLAVPLWAIADLTKPMGRGEKLILREVARRLGLAGAAALPKRAIQFGCRIAKASNVRDFGSNRAANLSSAGGLALQGGGGYRVRSQPSPVKSKSSQGGGGYRGGGGVTTNPCKEQEQSLIHK
ncbi:hypothetical protein CBR_g50115 [Chara braunii]|uniref:Asparagine synthetase domain-containing protein n=1 Tax=Chara braunii TaxID=69332 RepID=A0A388M6C5_CHABU|nr:hypothetical protein CBR_g50115 [Chara braunii]|eukprot:GBG90022.1 hypothetical protein CBR_g50115 [Chara braunii]